MGALDTSAAGFAAAPEPLLLLLAAIALESLWRSRQRPAAFSAAVLFARLARWLELRLNRPQRSDQKRLARGVVATAFLLAVAIAAGLLTVALRDVPFGWIAYLFVLIAALSLRPGLDDARAIDAGLRTGAGAMQHAAARVFGAGAEAMGEAAIARKTGAHLAAHLVDGFAAPILWFVLLGPAGMLAYVAVTAAADIWPEHSARHQEFGLAVSRLRVALRWIPDWIATLAVVVAAVVTPGGHPAQAFGAAAGRLAQFRPARGPRTTAALFGAMSIAVDRETLRQAGTRGAAPHWHGDASAVLRAAARADVRRAAYLYRVAGVLGVAGLAVVALIRFAA